MVYGTEDFHGAYAALTQAFEMENQKLSEKLGQYVILSVKGWGWQAIDTNFNLKLES